MNKPKVIVHGDVPKDAIEAAEKLAKEMGVDEIHISSPELARETMEDTKGRKLDGAIIMARDRVTGETDLLPEMPRDMALAILEGLSIPYNGVEGDSHDCPACNARRQEMGPDLSMDAKKGIPKGRYNAQLNAGPGKDVAGTPMFRMPKAEFPKDSVFNRPYAGKESTLKGVQEVLDTVRAKQDKHFKMCDELSDKLQEVKDLLNGDKPMEAFQKLQEVEKILDREKV